MGTFTNVIKSVLSVLYNSFWFSVLLAFLFMFFFLFAKENGIKGTFKKWGEAFKASWRFRRVLVLAFFGAMILMQTLFNRFTWGNPLDDIMGDWAITVGTDGKVNTRCLENILLMLPFILVLFWAFADKLMAKVTLWTVVWRSTVYSLGFSLAIEFMQLFGRLGSFQLSDLFYNTVGGLLGGLIYYLIYRIAHRKERGAEDLIALISFYMVLGTMALIFIFSHQSGGASSETSGFFARLLGIENPDAPIIFGLTIRKIAHITIYFVLGMFTYLALYGIKLRPILALGICYAYAVSDEIHQLFIPGRAGAFTDTLIDGIGFTLAIAIAFALRTLIIKLNKKAAD